MRHLNYGHLLYFWTVAREGSVTRAARTLHLTPQTISGQLRTLEEQVGTPLFVRAGRRLVLSDMGRVVFHYADEIFELGTELAEVVKGRVPGGPLVLEVGVTDVVPKLIAYRVLESALSYDRELRIVCREGKLDKLLAELATHDLDLVLADRPLPPSVNVRAFNHLLGESGISFFASGAAASALRRRFPQGLDGAPMLLPTRDTVLRALLEQWFDAQGVYPRIAGEFEDAALLKSFGQAGIGAFVGPTAIEAEIVRQYRARVVGRTDAVRERFYAISAERKLKHPAVVAITEAARSTLFAALTEGR